MVYGTSEHIQIDQERNEKTSERLNYFVARLDGSGSSTSCPPGKAPYLFSLFSCSPLQGPDKRVASTDPAWRQRPIVVVYRKVSAKVTFFFSMHA